MGSASRWLALALGVATFLAAAKTHGRQLRLERELAGYWNVTFGGRNPPFVEALWRRERLIFWGLAALFAASTVGYRALGQRPGWSSSTSWAGALLLHVVAPLSAAFVVSGLLSVVRFALAVRAAAESTSSRPEGWWTGAAWGTAAWWGLTLVVAAAFFFVARRHTA